jgi:hypothetical protein
MQRRTRDFCRLREARARWFSVRESTTLPMFTQKKEEKTAETKIGNR